MIVGGLLALFPVYFLGVMTSQVADIWIDQPSCWYHMGLKSLWNDYGDDKTDDSIKCAVYSSVFCCKEDLCKEGGMDVDKVHEWYHEINNYIVMMKNDKFRRYVLYSQKQVSVARLWVFVFLFVFVACLVRLVFLFGRGWYKRHLKLSVGLRESDLFSVLIIAPVALILYVVGGNVWVEAERETSLKVWRFAKSHPKEVSWSISKLDKCTPESESGESSLGHDTVETGHSRQLCGCDADGCFVGRNCRHH